MIEGKGLAFVKMKILFLFNSYSSTENTYLQ